MRPFRIQALIEQLNAEARNKPLDQAMELWVRFHGAATAGWLVFTHRKRFHRSGMVDFHMPKNVETPPWFRVAIATLEKREGWRVIVQIARDERIYRVTWLGWHTHRGTKEIVLS